MCLRVAGLGLNLILRRSLNFSFLNYQRWFALVVFMSGNDSSVFFSKSFSSGSNSNYINNGTYQWEMKGNVIL